MADDDVSALLKAMKEEDEAEARRRAEEERARAAAEAEHKAAAAERRRQKAAAAQKRKESQAMKEKEAAARRSQAEAEKLAESRARRRQARDAKLRKQEDYAAQPQMPPPAPQHTRSATEQCQRRYRQARRWYRRHGHTAVGAAVALLFTIAVIAAAVQDSREAAASEASGLVEMMFAAAGAEISPRLSMHLVSRQDRWHKDHSILGTLRVANQARAPCAPALPFPHAAVLMAAQSCRAQPLGLMWFVLALGAGCAAVDRVHGWAAQPLRADHPPRNPRHAPRRRRGDLPRVGDQRGWLPVQEEGAAGDGCHGGDATLRADGSERGRQACLLHPTPVRPTPRFSPPGDRG